MTRSAEMIVLSSTKFGEGSIILHTICKGMGRRGFMVRVGKGASMAHFQPLNILEAEVTENQHSQLWNARKFTARHALGGIRTSISKNAMTMFMSEVLYRTVRDGSDEDGLYEWLEKEILTLDALEADFSNFHIRFLFDLAAAMGFTPEFEDIVPFAGNRLREMEEFMHASFSESMLIPMNGQVRNEMAEILLKYLGYHTESTINIRSLAVLRELFA